MEAKAIQTAAAVLKTDKLENTLRSPRELRNWVKNSVLVLKNLATRNRCRVDNAVTTEWSEINKWKCCGIDLRCEFEVRRSITTWKNVSLSFNHDER